MIKEELIKTLEFNKFTKEPTDPDMYCKTLFKRNHGKEKIWRTYVCIRLDNNEIFLEYRAEYTIDFNYLGYLPIMNEYIPYEKLDIKRLHKIMRHTNKIKNGLRGITREATKMKGTI